MLPTPNNRFTFLGTGTSTGVPIPNCSCETCSSSDPRDSRLRCSCWIEVDGLSLVIDTGPDFREQVLRNRISNLDAVLYTHAHFDHVAGLCDLRSFLFRNSTPLPCYASPSVAAEIRRVNHFIFVERYRGTPDLDLIEVEDQFEICPRLSGRDQEEWNLEDPVWISKESRLAVQPLPINHGSLPIFGYRIGKLAYVTDVSHIPDSTLAMMQGVETLVIGALHYKTHPTHNTIPESIEIARKVGAKKTYFIHMTHSILHARDEVDLPEDVFFAYDGLSLDF